MDASLCSALRAYYKSRATASSTDEGRPHPSPPELELVNSSEPDVMAWKQERLAADMLSYQKSLISDRDTSDIAGATNIIGATDTTDSIDTTDAMDVEIMESDSHVTHKGDYLTFGELLENMDDPPLISKVRVKLDGFTKTL